MSLTQHKIPKTEGNHVVCYSIRAWRGLRYNAKYASKLERKLARRREHQRAPPAPSEGAKSMHQSVNPFSVRCDLLWRVFRANYTLRCPLRWPGYRIPEFPVSGMTYSIQ